MSAEPPNNNPDDELKELWLGQKLEGGKMSLEEIRKRARSFERQIRKRNLIEYMAAVIVFVSFGIQVFTAPNRIMAAGNGLVVLGTAYIVYALYTRGSSQTVPDELGQETFLNFYRTSLVRQRNLLLNVWKWYLLPLVPGVVVILIGAAVRDGVLLSATREPAQIRNGLFMIPFVVFVTSVFIAVASWNKRVARKIQSQIDALDQ